MKKQHSKSFRQILTIIFVLCIMSIIPFGGAYAVGGCCGAGDQSMVRSNGYGKLALLLPAIGIVGIIVLYAGNYGEGLEGSQWANTALPTKASRKKKR